MLALFSVGADRMVDLIADNIDVAIRVAHLEDSSLVARALGDDPRTLVAAACAGGGILAIDRLLVDEEVASGALVPALPDHSLRPGQPICAVYPARPWLAFKTATFIAFLQERLLAPPGPAAVKPRGAAPGRK